MMDMAEELLPQVASAISGSNTGTPPPETDEEADPTRSDVFQDDAGRRIVVQGEYGVPHFLQNDERWADTPLGETGTIGTDGSALVCVAMVLAHYGRDVDPSVLDQWLDDHAGFLGDTLRFDLAFDCGEVENSPQLAFVQEVDAATEGESYVLALVTERVQSGAPTILRVAVGEDSTPHHVVVVGVDAEGLPLINDPAVAEGNAVQDPSLPEAGLFTSPRGYRIEKAILHAVES